MFVTRNVGFFGRLIVGIVGVLTVGLTARAQVFTGSISFVGGATLDQAIPNATTITSFYGPGGPGTDPQVQGGQETGAYASVPGGTLATFAASFPFNPAIAMPFQLWSFSTGGVTYSFDITSITSDPSQEQQVVNGLSFLSLTGTGMGYISTYTGGTPELWSITGTTANSGSLTITMGNSVNAVPEPGVFGFLLLGGLLLGGWMFAKHGHLKLQEQT